LRRCRWLGVELDPAANEAGGPRITTPQSPVSAWVIPTDEEAVIARQAVATVQGPVRTAALPGGRTLTVRRITPGDADELARLYEGLNEDDRYRRFFS